MTQATTEQLEYAWGLLQSLVPVSVIRTEHQYDQALATLDPLLDTVGDDETHPLYDLLDTLGVLIHTPSGVQNRACFAFRNPHQPQRRWR